jgi:N6-adenosine-specific RNA methylase IME4
MPSEFMHHTSAVVLRDVDGLNLHEHVRLVPEMTGSEYSEFRESIASSGIQVPLDVAGNVVLDGRHRLRAAKELKLSQVPCRLLTLTGESETEYLLKMALLRRHLSDDQRAAMAALWKEHHARRQGRPPKNFHSAVGVSSRPQPAMNAPKLFNLPRRKVDEATFVLERAPERLEEVHRGERRLKDAVRQLRVAEEAARVRELKPAMGEYPVIVVDPPWPYESRSEDPSHRGTIPYPAMTLDEIKALSIPAAENCILWLWTTNAFMEEAFAVLRAWEFTPKTILTWGKHRLGLGNWLRNQTEHCILAIKGRPVVTLSNQTTLLHAPAEGHSEKPDAFYTLVESLCPGAKLELFARRTRDDWETHGT